MATDDAVMQRNLDFYGKLWASAELARPDAFNTWPMLATLAARSRRRLEIGPGLRPRLPIAGTHFVDLSHEALEKLASAGGIPQCTDAARLPYPDAFFDLVVAFDVVEHVADDASLFGSVARVTKPGALWVLSAPLHPDRWTRFDAFVGHARRYEPAALIDRLDAHGFRVERSAGFGMKPQSAWLTELGLYGLEHYFTRAMRWYNRVLMPIAIARQRRLEFRDGLIDIDATDEVVLVCKRVQP